MLWTPKKTVALLAPGLLTAASPLAHATETENLNLSVLPASGAVTVDALPGDGDLTGGTLACGDVENMRDPYGIWVHTMWDAENLYILARWMDLTPMSNPGSIKGDYGFNGDCLQVRVLTAPADKLAGAATRGSCWPPPFTPRARMRCAGTV